MSTHRKQQVRSHNIGTRDFAMGGSGMVFGSALCALKGSSSQRKRRKALRSVLSACSRKRCGTSTMRTQAICPQRHLDHLHDQRGTLADLVVFVQLRETVQSAANNPGAQRHPMSCRTREHLDSSEELVLALIGTDHLSPIFHVLDATRWIKIPLWIDHGIKVQCLW